MELDNKILDENEEIIYKLYKTRIGYISFYMLLLFLSFIGIILLLIQNLIIIGIFIIIIVIFIYLILELLRKKDTYYVTNKKLIHQEKFFSINIKTLEYSQLKSIEVKQSYFERSLEVGTLKIIATGDINLQFESIQEIYEVKKTIEKYIHNSN